MRSRNNAFVSLPIKLIKCPFSKKAKGEKKKKKVKLYKYNRSYVLAFPCVMGLVDF